MYKELLRISLRMRVSEYVLTVEIGGELAILGNQGELPRRVAVTVADRELGAAGH